MKEKILIWIVWHLPRTIVYWCSIRLMAYATTGKYETQAVNELTLINALQRWEK